MNGIGERLRKARLRAGLKQKQVAEKLGCAATSITNWENGKVLPSMEVLEQLCGLYGILPTSLLSRPYIFDDLVATAKKPVAERSYGGIGRIGGGALSGKDPSKVDRSAAYMARKIARDIVLAGYADKCEIQIAYAIGVTEPVGVAIECFGTEIQTLDFIQAYVRDSYDLTPRGIIKRLDLLNVDYNQISAYGHFTNPYMPWEQ